MPKTRGLSVRVRPCPMESIRQHFTPSVNTSVYFSKSLAIGLPVSRTVAYPRRSDSVRVYWTCMEGKLVISFKAMTNDNLQVTQSVIYSLYFLPLHTHSFSLTHSFTNLLTFFLTDSITDSHIHLLVYLLTQLPTSFNTL